MKRIISFILALVLLVPPMVVPTIAAEVTDSYIRVTVDKTENVSVGDQVTATVTGAGIYDIGAITLMLAYDPDYLVPVEGSLTRASALSGTFANNLAGPIKEAESKELAGKTAVKLAGFSTNGSCYSGNGDMMSVSFTVKKAAAAPGIPLELAVNLVNVYDSREMNGQVRLENTHIAAVDATKSITAVSLKATPTKTFYVQGQALDLAGGLMEVTYSDTSTKEIPLRQATISGYDSNKIGNQLVRASYGGKEVTFNVLVQAKALESITVSALPDKVEYILGTAALDLSGGILLKNYTNGNCEVVEMTDASVVVAGYNKNSVGFQTISISLEGYTTTFLITVVSKAVKSVAIVSNPKTEYIQGQEFDCTGGKVLVTYSDNSTEEIKMVPQMVRGFEKEKVGRRDIEIVYGSKKTTLSVTSVEVKETSIEMAVNPTKMEYIQGQVFDPAGGKIRVFYNNGTEQLIDLSKAIISNNLMTDGKFNSSGNYILQVTYKNLKTQLAVVVQPKTLSALEIAVMPQKQTYVEGQALDLTGGILKATYNDGEILYPDLTEATYSGYDPYVLGEQTITITYGNKNIPMKVHVIAKVLTGITIDTEMMKTEYIEGQDLSLAGGIIVAAYNDESTREIPLSNGVVSGYDANQIGEQTLSVSYGGFETSYKVTVREKVLLRIEVTPPSKTAYIQGQEFSTEGMNVTAYYDNDTDQEISLNQVTIRGYDKELVQEQTIEVSYGGKTDRFTVTVEEKQLLNIAAVNYKAQYIIGDALDLTIGELQLNYNNGIPETLALNAQGVIITGFDPQTEGEQELAISYGGFNASMIVNVFKPVKSISIATNPKTEYIEGQALDLTGGMVKIIYTNDYSEELSLQSNAFSVSGYNPAQIGAQTITVALGEFITQFEINVAAKSLVSIAIQTPPQKVDYIEGEIFDATGLVVFATYNNGLPAEEVDFDQLVFSGYNMRPETYGEQTVTVGLGEEHATFTIHIRQRSVASIKIQTMPDKTTYVEGQALDVKGGMLLVTYDNKDTQEIPLSQATVQELQPDLVELQSLLVTYEGKTTTLEIMVIARSVTKVEIHKEPANRTFYETQTELELSEIFADGVLKVIYNDETFDYVDFTEAQIFEFDLTPGEKDVTVNYASRSVTFKVQVLAQAAESIAVIEPDNVEYIEGQDLDLTGGYIIVYYNDGYEEEIALDDPAVLVSGYDANPETFGAQELTVTYGDFTETFEVLVRAKQVEKISVDTLPKTSYLEGKDKTLDLSGGMLKVVYDNGDEKEVPLTEATATGFSATKLGEQTIKVTYLGKETSYKIQMAAKSITEIKVTTNPKMMEYEQGFDDWNPAGGILTIYYNNGTSKDLALGDASIKMTGFDNLETGACELTFIYNGKKAKLTVTILPEHEHYFTDSCDPSCNRAGCEYIRTVKHTYSNACDKICNICGADRTVGAHKYTNACDKTCEECGATRTVGAHKYSNACDKSCNECGATRTVGAHKYSNACDKTCNECGAARTIKHSYKKVYTKATLSANGKIQNKCSVCGYVASKVTTIHRISSVALSTSAYTYNGEEKKPNVIIKDTAGKTLVKGTDYAVSYESGRKLPGEYTVKVTFKGKYGGTAKRVFTIAPQKVEDVSATQTTTTIALKWSKVTGAAGYRVYQYNETTGKYVAIKNVSANTITIANLKVGTNYRYRVRAFDKDGGYIWGAYSATYATATKPKAPALTVSSKSKGKATFSWTNVSGESGYQIYYKTSSGGSYKKLNSYKVNVTKATKTKLTSGKTYYFRIRAYKKSSAGVVYSSWSATKKVKIK